MEQQKRRHIKEKTPSPKDSGFSLVSGHFPGQNLINILRRNRECLIFSLAAGGCTVLSSLRRPQQMPLSSWDVRG